MDILDLKRKVSQISWYHSIDLGNGLVTQGVCDMCDRLKMMKIPDSYSGESVLDVGCADGYFSFDAESKGASSVLAVDKEQSKGFALAREALSSSVQYETVRAEEISNRIKGSFDVVFLIQVLYHLSDLLGCIRSVSSLCKRLCIVETLCHVTSFKEPSMFFHPMGQLDVNGSSQSYSVFWPNPELVEAAFLDAGFRKINVVGSYPIETKWKDSIGSFQQRIAWHALK